MDLLISLRKAAEIAMLVVTSAAGLLGYAYISLKALNPSQPYEEKKLYAIAGGICVFMTCFLDLSVVVLIQRPTLEMIPLIFFVSLIAGGLMFESIISPAQLAKWWMNRFKQEKHNRSNGKGGNA